MPNNDTLPLGPWSQDELEKTTLDDTGAGDDAGIPSNTRFKREVHRLIKKRSHQPSYTSDPNIISVFLLSPNPHCPELNLHFEPMLNSGHKQISSRVWFVSEAVTSGHYYDLQITEDSEIFSLVVKDFDLGNITAIVVNYSAHPTELRFYPNGLADLDTCSTWDVVKKDITTSSVYNAIDGVHKTCLLTSSSQSGIHIWKDNYPSRRAEKLIQSLVRSGLAAAFLDFRINEEQNTAAGRYDLTIEDHEADHKIYALLELKVLRSHGETGTKYPPDSIPKIIKEGIEQAYSYKFHCRAAWSSLCCFDMREHDHKETCFDPVRTFAESNSIELWRWYLYHTSKDLRRALTPWHQS